MSPASAAPWVRATSWLHEEGAAIEIRPEPEPRGKYTVLNSGHLLVHHTSAYDSYKRYTCKAQHRLTGQRRRSLAAARLTLTGKAIRRRRRRRRRRRTRRRRGGRERNARLVRKLTVYPTSKGPLINFRLSSSEGAA